MSRNELGLIPRMVVEGYAALVVSDTLTVDQGVDSREV